MADKGTLKHWPTIFFGVAVGAMLLVAVFSYQVGENELAVVTTLGSVERQSPAPGLHFRWPYPFQEVLKFDKRCRCFTGNEGRLEETQTADNVNVLVGIFVNYSISDAVAFATQLENITQAEALLNSQMRSVKNAAFGRYKFNQLFSPTESAANLTALQNSIQSALATQLAPYGLKIESVGINVINLPVAVTSEILKRMVAECQLEAQTYIVKGNNDAQTIRLQADSDSRAAIADAEAKSKETRAEGDAEAAKFYEVFREDPELAMFLRNLDSLRRIMKTRTTLVVDTTGAPFNLLRFVGGSESK